MLLEVIGVGKSFGSVAALQNVSFTVAPGTIHALMGENGAGKSTLIKILTGIVPDYAGRILLDKKPLVLHEPRDAQNQWGIACIHQELSLVPQMSVAENLFLAREPRTRWKTVDFPHMEDRARDLLARLGLSLDVRRPVQTLGIGEQQMVEIARALSLNARLLLLDEPTSALSKTEIEHLMRVLEGLRESGVTMIYISHKTDEVFRLADAITVLRDGKCVGTLPKADAKPEQIIGMMAGRSLDVLYPKTAVPLGEEVLRVEGFCLGDGSSAHAFGPAYRRRLYDISFTLCKGEILGVAGLMGAGRTELLEALYGTSGRTRQVRARRLVVAGKETKPFAHPAAALRAGLALVSEDRKGKSLVLPQSVQNNMTLASLRQFLRGGWVQAKHETQTVRQQMDRFRIKALSSQTIISSLSGGNQQKVVLARCLLTRPRILLLDEPTRGIDVNAKAEIYRIIGELVKGGMSVVMASSEMPELLGLCDRIMVLSEGRLTAVFDRADATQEKILAAASAAAAAQPSFTQEGSA